MEKRAVFLYVMVALFLISLCGNAYFGILLSDKNELIADLTSSNEEMTKELSDLYTRQESTYVVYEMMRDVYFSPKLGASSITSLAILLNNKKICDGIESEQGTLFCTDIFDNSCSKYEYPNRETCVKLRSMLERKVSPSDLLAQCSSKEYIEGDLAHAHCLQHFARITNNIDLCSAICKSPIDNTNCQAYCKDDENNPLPCKDLYTQDCVKYVLENNPTVDS